IGGCAYTQYRRSVRGGHGQASGSSTRSNGMNTSSKTMGGAFESQAVAPAVKAPTRPYYWSVRRELWEYRSIYFAPLIVAGVFLFGFLITMLTLPHRLRALSPKNTAANTPYDVAAGLILGAAF